MRFSGKDIQTLVLFVAAAYVLHLGITDALALYIHPRYIPFTITMSVIGIVVILADAWTQKKRDNHNHHAGKLSMLPLAVVLGAAVVLPARSLSSATVSQRSIDAGSLVVSTDTKPIHTLFAGSTRGLSVSDWSRLIQTNSSPAYYANKPATVSGFVYDAGLGQDTVWLARFIVTCCAVDAQPVGVPVRIEGWDGHYEEDEWVEVEGTFQESETSRGTELVLMPSSVQQIEEPSNPYAN